MTSRWAGQSPSKPSVEKPQPFIFISQVQLMVITWSGTSGLGDGRRSWEWSSWPRVWGGEVMWTQVPSALDEGQPGGALGKRGGERLTPHEGDEGNVC